MSWRTMHWDVLWAAAKDVVLTGTGVTLILSQVFASSPSDILLATGLALTVPSVASHARILLSGGPSGGGQSSPSSPSPGPPPSTSSSEAVSE